MTGHEHMRGLRIVYRRYTLHELIELMSAQTGLQIRLGPIEVPLLPARGQSAVPCSVDLADYFPLSDVNHVDADIAGTDAVFSAFLSAALGA